MMATKLIAGKRPRLYPIWDSAVSEALGAGRAHLNPVREALRADDAALHRRLLSIREEAGLPQRGFGNCGCSMWSRDGRHEPRPG